MVYLTNPIFWKASKSDTDQLVDVIYAGFSHHFKHLRTTESKVKAILKEILKIELDEKEVQELAESAKGLKNVIESLNSQNVQV